MFFVFAVVTVVVQDAGNESLHFVQSMNCGEIAEPYSQTVSTAVYVHTTKHGGYDEKSIGGGNDDGDDDDDPASFMFRDDAGIFFGR